MSHIDGTRKSYSSPYEITVCMTKEECKILLPFFQKAYKSVKSKYEKYNDIHNGGEATEREENLLMKYSEQLERLESVLSSIDEILKLDRYKIGMNMSGKDVLRLLLISYGFCRNIEISTYIGDGGWIGYEVSASNDDGIEYYEVDCEGLLFHIYEIQKFMRYENIEPRSMLGNFSNKHLLSDDSLNKLLNMSENKNYCKTNPYE